MTEILKRAACGFAVVAALLLAATAPSHAGVTITFYSHKFHLFHGVETEFPHGFVILSGTAGDGETINRELGFSATDLYALALLMPINGALDGALPDGYMDGAVYHFAFPLTDAQYGAVMAVAEKWRTAAQPSYDFYTRNCVTFVRDIAIAAGLSVSDEGEFIHDPKGFLDDVAVRNAAFLAPYANQPSPPAMAAPPAGDLTALRARLLQLDKQKNAAQSVAN